MDLELRDRVAVITGGASGIGEACARGFAAEGAEPVVWDLAVDEDGANDPGQPLAIRADITSESDLHRALERTLDRFDRIDHLVHAAAIGSGKFGFPFTNLTPVDWRRTIEVNVLGMTNVAHAVSPHMIENRSGTQVYIASIAGQIGSQTDPPYSASKAANINFAQCLAKDLAPSGIRVNTICPGMVKTPLNRSVWQAWRDVNPDENTLTYDEWAGEKIKSLIPLGTWAKVEDVADMVLFLSSNRAQQVTGQTINVDGGFVMHW